MDELHDDDEEDFEMVSLLDNSGSCIDAEAVSTIRSAEAVEHTTTTRLPVSNRSRATMILRRILFGFLCILLVTVFLVQRRRTATGGDSSDELSFSNDKSTIIRSGYDNDRPNREQQNSLTKGLAGDQPTIADNGDGNVVQKQTEEDTEYTAAVTKAWDDQSRSSSAGNSEKDVAKDQTEQPDDVVGDSGGIADPTNEETEVSPGGTEEATMPGQNPHGNGGAETDHSSSDGALDVNDHVISDQQGSSGAEDTGNFMTLERNETEGSASHVEAENQTENDAGYGVIEDQTAPDSGSIASEVASSREEHDAETFSTADPELKADELEVPHVVYSDLHYRRVCAPVHSSVLCLTIRFPFPVPLQDPVLTYASPFDPQFEKLKIGHVYTTDELEQCEEDVIVSNNSSSSTSTTTSVEDKVYQCLEHSALLDADTGADTGAFAHAIYTRRRSDNNRDDANEAVLYGTSSKQQRDRLRDFFGDTLIVVFGDSTAHCRRAHMEDLVNATKYRKNLHYADMIPNRTYAISTDYYHKDTFGSELMHDLPGISLLEYIKTGHFNAAMRVEPGRKAPRGLSVMSLYPIAHAQNEAIIFDHPDVLERLNTKFQPLFLSVDSQDGREDIFNVTGLDLTSVFVFDGSPQAHPTSTGAYNPGQYYNKPNGTHYYPGWKAEYGTACRGPVPPHSPLTAVKDTARDAWKDAGFDMKWYGRTWEFENQFWWEHGPDCTHGGGAGLCGVHNFFIMAMVDDHYDNQNQRRRSNGQQLR